MGSRQTGRTNPHAALLARHVQWEQQHQSISSSRTERVAVSCPKACSHGRAGTCAEPGKGSALLQARGAVVNASVPGLYITIMSARAQLVCALPHAMAKQGLEGMRVVLEILLEDVSNLP
jgi:hypothetical protein